MKKKYLLLALALILPLTFAGAHPMQRSAQSADEAEARKRIASDFAEALLLAQEKSASPVDYDRAAKASINGMLRTLDPHGTQVVVKVDRLGVGPMEFKLTRGAVPLPSLSNSFILGNGIGYINLD